MSMNVEELTKACLEARALGEQGKLAPPAEARKLRQRMQELGDDAEDLNDPDDDDEDDREAIDDLMEALSLLSKTAHLLAVVSDVSLCKTVTKRERTIMSTLEKDISAYLESVLSAYEQPDNSD